MHMLKNTIHQYTLPVIKRQQQQQYPDRDNRCRKKKRKQKQKKKRKHDVPWMDALDTVFLTAQETHSIL
jgi:hypothetical protein